MKQLSPPLDGFWWHLISGVFLKMCLENSSFIKIRQEHRVLRVKWQYLAEFFSGREMLQTQVAGKIKPHTPFKFSNVFPKTVLFIRRCRNIWWSQRRRKQYGGCAFTLETSFPRLCNNSHMHVNTHTHALTHASASARTHARAHTQEIRNTYCFFTATMVWRSASLLRYT